VLRDATWLDGRVFGMAVMAVTIAWIGGSIVASQRMKLLYVDPSRTAVPDAPAPTSGEGQ
jgi:ATP synthase protein I